MLSDRLTTDLTLGFKVAGLFAISDRLTACRPTSVESVLAISGLHCPDRPVSPALRETRSPGPRTGSNGKFSANESAAFRVVSMSQLMARLCIWASVLMSNSSRYSH